MNIHFFYSIILFCIFAAFLTLFTKYNAKPTTISTGFIMTDRKEIDTLQKLQALHDFVLSIDIIETNKEKILKTIQFEIELIERQVYMSLGKEKYKELKIKL